MHLGTFPDGIEFATFVMSRDNYPFENMSVEDHDRLFADPHNTPAALTQLTGAWNGRLILVPSTSDTLLNQVSPVTFGVTFVAQASLVSAQYRVGPAQFSQSLDGAAQANFRAIDGNTLLGRCTLPQPVASLPGGAVLHFLLTR
jgi:hypothetical protein